MPLAPDSPESLLRSWHELDAAVFVELLPDLDPPEYAETLRNLQSGPHVTRWVHAAVSDGQVVGCVHGELWLSDNQHLGGVDVYVRADHRRRGIGTALLAHATEILAADNRRSMTGEAPAGSAGAAFGRARGADEKLGELRSSLDVTVLDDDHLGHQLAAAEQASGDYELLRWKGRCPDDLVEAYAAVAHAMNSAPRGELDLEDLAIDTDRMRHREERVASTGARSYVVVARKRGASELAGFTELVVTPGGATGMQEDTGVITAHRGHRLGLRVKAAMLQWLRDEEPDLRVVTTWNAETNGHMLAINWALGFQRQERWSALQVDVARLRNRGAAAVSGRAASPSRP